MNNMTTLETQSHHTVTADFIYVFTDPATDASGFFEAIVSHLYDLDAQDVFLAIDHKAATFTLSLMVEAQEEKMESIIAKGLGTMRSAFHACGASTPDWPTASEAMVKVEACSASIVKDRTLIPA
jgi:hypothetical protein